MIHQYQSRFKLGDRAVVDAVEPYAGSVGYTGPGLCTGPELATRAGPGDVVVTVLGIWFRGGEPQISVGWMHAGASHEAWITESRLLKVPT